MVGWFEGLGCRLVGLVRFERLGWLGWLVGWLVREVRLVRLVGWFNQPL